MGPHAITLLSQQHSKWQAELVTVGRGGLLPWAWLTNGQHPAPVAGVNVLLLPQRVL